jgi:hypothetical protein
MKFKQKIHDYFLKTINEKIDRLQQVLSDLKETGANETKSTAGDKHETALAMVQIEQANVRSQLKEALEQKAAIEKINPLISAPIIVHGSLVKTNHGYLFLSTALGKANIQGNTIIALSAQSPLGMKLMKLAVGDTVTMNNTHYVVEEIL